MTPLQTLREAMQLARTGRVDDAIARLKECLDGARSERNKRDLALLARNAGLLCDQAGRLQECAEYYKAALRLDPEDVHILWALGDVYARAGRGSLSSRYWKQFEQTAARSKSSDVKELLQRHRARQKST